MASLDIFGGGFFLPGMTVLCLDFGGYHGSWLQENSAFDILFNAFGVQLCFARSICPSGVQLPSAFKGGALLAAYL